MYILQKPKNCYILNHIACGALDGSIPLLVLYRGHSVHSSGQIEWYTNTMDDKSIQVGGKQRIITH